MSPFLRDTLEQLLLAQAVYQVGSQDWHAVARVLNDHPLTKQQGDWSDTNAREAYSDILESNPPFEPGILEPGANPLSFPPREKAALWVAQLAYKARMSDIKVEIQGEEEKFKVLVHEMEALKSLPTLSPSPSPSPPPPPPPPPPKPVPAPKPIPAPAPWRNPKHGPNTHPKHAIPKTWGPNTHPKHAMPRPIGPNTHPKHAMPKGSNTHPKHAMPKPGQPPGTVPVKGVRGGKASYVHLVGDGKKGGSPAPAQSKASTSAQASAVASTSKASTPAARSPKILAFPPRKQSSLAPSTPAASTGSPLASTSFTAAAALSRPASVSASAAPSPASSTTSSSRPTTSAYARRPSTAAAAGGAGPSTGGARASRGGAKAEPVALTAEQLAAAEAKRMEILEKKAKERLERNEKKERDRKKKMEDRERWKKTRDEKRKRERDERNALAVASGSSFVPPSPPRDEGDDSFFADESFAQSREGSDDVLYLQDQDMD